MRYIGNKDKLISRIHQILRSHNVCGDTFFDFFSGTASVARYYKALGYRVGSSDMMYMSFCMQKAYVENNEAPKFYGLRKIIQQGSATGRLFSSPLESVLYYLDNIPDVEGFIYNNYTPGGTKTLKLPRMYFSDDNGRRIDAIRQQIEVWKEAGLLTDHEYYILLTCLIETVSYHANVAGIYAAFQKKWDPRALKRLHMREIRIYDNGKSNVVYNENSMNLLGGLDADILYLDPPYNERQYPPNYHILETIARYDSPVIKGVTGMRDYSAEKSSFCNAKTALVDLDRIASTAKYKYLVMSYNSEGIMPKEAIMSILAKYGNIVFEQFAHTRFKSNNNGLSRTRKNIFEQLYILKH